MIAVSCGLFLNLSFEIPKNVFGDSVFEQTPQKGPKNQTHLPSKVFRVMQGVFKIWKKVYWYGSWKFEVILY